MPELKQRNAVIIDNTNTAMYIKRLDITGFKSFADKIKLELSPGISTVVGPNGCGKSNIIDAVRWVLGEQKYSILRSKAMDEVVFVGTAHRKPGGMAQVSLTFDNTDGRLPFEFPEVILTRRAFKDGGGQYLLNNRNVRLKDVQELLADTGIGSGALFVLSNQEIERVLSPNSHERRSVLEETAGINKYQMRKKETLQRLASTKENIVRLNDILQEVGRQLDLCAQQMKKLEKYRKTKEKLQKMEVTLLFLDFHELKEQEKTLDSLCAGVEEERTTLEELLERMQGEIIAGENRCNQYRVEYEAVREAYRKAGLEEEKIRGSSNLTEEKIRQGEAALNEYRENLARIEERIASAEKGIEENRELLQQAEESGKKWNAAFDEIQTECTDREKTFGIVRDQIDLARKTLAELMEQRNILRVKRDHSLASCADARIEKDRHEKRITQMQADMTTAGKRIEEFSSKEATLRAKKEQVESGRDEMESRRNGLIQEAQQEFQGMLKLKEELREARSEIAVLLREEESYRGFSPAFQALMGQKAFLPNLVPVHTVIRVDEKYETAAEVVLGAHFQSIITENRDDAQICIDLLKKERLGRLTFFPMDLDRRPSENWKEMPRGLPGIVGWAKDLIQTDHQYRDIVDMICGRTLIVKNMDAAYKIYEHQKRIRDFIPKMVTLDGDVLEYSGAVTGGRHRTERSHLLSRSRRREELEQQVTGKTKELAKREEKIQTLNETVSSLEKEWKETLQAYDDAEREFRESSGQLQVLRRMQERGEEDIQRLRETIGELEEKINREERQVEDFERLEQELTGKITARDSDVQRIEEENRDLIKDLETVRERREEIRKHLEEAGNRVRLLQARIQADTTHIGENRRDRTRFLELAKTREEEIKQLRNDLQDTKNKVSILSLRLKSLTLGLESSRKSVEEAEQSLEELRKKRAEQEKTRGILDERLNRHKIEKIENETRKTYVKDRLREYPEEIRQSVSPKNANRDEVSDTLEKTRKALTSFDTVNFSAEEEFNVQKERYNTLQEQIDDLNEASRSLKNIIREMDAASLLALEETLNLLNTRFDELFKKVFNGGKARIFFSDPENKLESGIEVEVQPPGKRTTNLNLLSSGEKSLTAVTFLFALLSIKPGPFILLDELDAPLDESNVEKIANLVREFSQRSQFLVITHNRKTMEFADSLIGITMEEPGVSKVVAVKFEDVEKFTEPARK